LDSSHKKRVLSGMRPTGRLHIGHYFGALQNWVKLQNDPQYECFFFVADWHALTSDYADTSQVAQNSIEIATDWLASGLIPAKCTMFLQSSVPEHAELQLLLSMVTPLGWLERVPTYKEALDNVKDKDLHTFGFLGYPILQTADIVMYGESESGLVVPVGEDQASHVELSREIVTAFNSLYGFTVRFEDWRREDYEGLVHAIYPRSTTATGSASGEPPRPKSVSGSRSQPHSVSGALGRAHSETRPITIEAFRIRVREEGIVNVAARITSESSKYFQAAPVLTEPQVVLTKTPRIPGTDGRKMSKSYGNFISLSESDESIRTKSRAMITDPQRKRRTDPGNPDVCPVYDWHKLFSPPETLAWSAEGCRTAGIGCIECKMSMADNLIKWIEPVRAKREEYAAHPAKVLRILDEGSEKAREVAQKTMTRVREAVFNWKEKRAEVAAQRTTGDV
jgi:tryptophanyl-tRNA synthetase